MKRFELFNLLLPSSRPFTSDGDLRDNISEAQEKAFVEACLAVVYGMKFAFSSQEWSSVNATIGQYARKGVGR